MKEPPDIIKQWIDGSNDLSPAVSGPGKAPMPCCLSHCSFLIESSTEFVLFLFEISGPKRGCRHCGDGRLQGTWVYRHRGDGRPRVSSSHRHHGGRISQGPWVHSRS